MASIKIANLQLAGTDFFNDSENYLNELTNQELDFVNGGIISGGCIVSIKMTIAPISICPPGITLLIS